MITESQNPYESPKGTSEQPPAEKAQPLSDQSTAMFFVAVLGGALAASDYGFIQNGFCFAITPILFFVLTVWTTFLTTYGRINSVLKRIVVAVAIGIGCCLGGTILFVGACVPVGFIAYPFEGAGGGQFLMFVWVIFLHLVIGGLIIWLGYIAPNRD